ncbi:hypothetical protein [uncultured Roseobacter sp.]|uniref:hypothetical protein n=1 Tax=uncultured Roseobacter sp. TaxID=114847 RepID=UPI002602827D|nr:hypothetical protein [uncultured Roseobacter sp.]
MTEMIHDHAPERSRLAPVLWVSLAFIFLVSLPNLIDPMIRHDDFPALLGYGDLFWNKTLHEGRWINYIWHLREIITPSWLNFAVYQICWAIFGACVAVAASPSDRLRVCTALLATMILIAPPATIISGWFNTLQLGLAIVALYAVIVCRCSERTSRFLLPVFTVPALMAYTTYPLLLLALCLVRTRERSIRDLFGLMVLFSLSFVGAMLITYALNWYVHGVFGIPLAEWRAATPAQTLADLWANAPWVKDTFFIFVSISSFNSDAVFFAHATCLALATLVIVCRAPLEALYLYAGLLTGVALVTLQALKFGIVVPARALLFFWVFYSVILVRGVQLLNIRASLAGRVGLGAVIVLVINYAMQTHKSYKAFHDWQIQTQNVAERLANYPEPVYVVGQTKNSQAGRDAGIQSSHGFYFRIRQLIGYELVICEIEEMDCSDIDLEAIETDAVDDWRITSLGGRTVLLVPDVRAPEDYGP